MKTILKHTILVAIHFSIFVFFIFKSSVTYAQVKSNNGNIWIAKEFSKDVALFNSKTFLFHEILGVNSEPLQFEIIPLSAASSGELTTLLYRCTAKGKEGIVLGFYGNYWNDAGVVYQGYAFKNFEKDSATQFLNKIDDAIDKYKKYLYDDVNNNNICFSFNDIDILIYATAGGYYIRLFWNGFDSSWDKTAFDRSKRRFEKKIK